MTDVTQTSHNALQFAVLITLAALALTAPLALEAAARAVLYSWVGAMPDFRAAPLYFLRAITSYGHANIYLTDRGLLLGAIEAVNGLIVFGLTTAFIYAAIRLRQILTKNSKTGAPRRHYLDVRR